MREIKFRGKRKDNNEWIYGSLCHDIAYNRYYISFLNEEIEDMESKEVILKTVGEFTSIKDENNKEIYEDDIISYYGYSAYGRDKIKTIELINWNNNCCGFDLYYITTINNGDIGLGCIDITIIGNKFDNPELLKSD